MIDNDFGCLRCITKEQPDEYSYIHNSLYGNDLHHKNSIDTLYPIAEAMGMDIRLTPGLSPDVPNIIVEGFTDQIYIHTMMSILGYDMNSIHIIPSTGAENIKNVCSILLGWEFKFLAVYDFDRTGKQCCQELEKNYNLKLASGFIMIKDITEEEFHKLGKIEDSDTIVIESLISADDRRRFGIDLHGEQQQKKINAARFKAAIIDGKDVSEETKENFKELIDRIIRTVNKNRN